MASCTPWINPVVLDGTSAQYSAMSTPKEPRYCALNRVSGTPDGAFTLPWPKSRPEAMLLSIWSAPEPEPTEMVAIWSKAQFLGIGKPRLPLNPVDRSATKLVAVRPAADSRLQMLRGPYTPIRKG